MKATAYAVFVAGAGLLAGWTSAHDSPAAGMPGHPGPVEAMLKDKLGLSDAQAEKLQAAHKARQEAATPLIKNYKEAIERLRAKVTLKYKDADVKASLDEVAAAKKALEAERAKFEAAEAAILTPTQQAKLVVFKAEHMAMAMHAARAMHGARGPMGPGMMHPPQRSPDGHEHAAPAPEPPADDGEETPDGPPEMMQ